jgi:hypothetical protein
MARIALSEFDPTAGTPSWAASLDECCVVKDPRRKKKREVNERGAVSLWGSLNGWMYLSGT